MEAPLILARVRELCPVAQVGIRSMDPDEYDLGRRNFLQALGTGAAAVLLLRVDDRLRVADSRLIRPPGVTDEAAFLSQCIRCSECMNACPTTAHVAITRVALIAACVTLTLRPAQNRLTMLREYRQR